MQFEGIYTPIITPFRDELTIDFDAYGRIIDWQADNGVHAIIVGGSTGEFFSLTQEERIEQFRFAVERVAGRLPVVAGVNDLLVDRCYELAAAARDAGANALLVAAPPYGLPGQEELAGHCLQIDRVAGLPIILYNYPGRTGVSMEREFLDRVAGSANFFPREAVRLYETCVLEGDFDKGRRMTSALLPLMICLEKGGKFLQSVKYACELFGRPGGPVRPPFRPMDEGLRV